MNDTIHRTFPRNWCNAAEKGIAAHFTFPGGEVAKYGAWKNHHGLYGNVYDLTTRTGTPRFGEAFGIEVRDDAASYWRGATVTQGIGLASDLEVYAVPGAARTVVTNGGEHQIRVDAAGTVAITLDNGGTWTTSPASIVGLGRIHVLADHDGTNQRLWLNGRIAAETASVLAVPAGGNLDVGQHGAVRRLVIPSAWIVAPRDRYVIELGMQPQWCWRPNLVGETGAAGILAGQVGPGDWYCVTGGVDTRFVHRAENNGVPAHLAFSSTAQQGGRLDFTATKIPWFGSWEMRYEIGDPTQPVWFALIPERSSLFWVAAAGAYWWDIGYVGATYTLRMYRDATLLATTDLGEANPGAGAVCRLLVSRDVQGDWRQRVSINGRWYGDDLAVANDVTYLSGSGIAILPGLNYISAIKKTLGELSPDSALERVALEVWPTRA